MSAAALLIIDLIGDFLEHWAPGDRAALVARTNELVALFREQDLPIIWVRQEFRADLSDAFLEMRKKGIAIAIEGTAGARLDPGLDWRQTDVTIIKKRYSAFFGTELDTLLFAIRPDELVIGGINTHACVRMAAIDAYQRDYEVVIASDCVDSYDNDHGKTTLAYLADKIAILRTNEEIAARLRR
jgi:bifunctional isochorismate lyase/aryl carrier protein